ncbi:MAG TPA: phosphatase PAP2 family protein [Allosphingosinicella sp.]|jgi:membrane-associated phospholipid phosphatase
MRRRTTLIALCVATAALPQPALARDERSWDHASSIGRDVLVVAALAVPAAKGDWRGDIQAGESMGAAVLVTGGLKELLPEWRPDRSDRKSFPSGHTSASFAAAASLQNRYGWKIGIPAQMVAAFVGLSRVEARKHHWYDVVAGAAIGEGAGFLLTSRRHENVRILPWGGTDGAGVAVAMRF